MYASDLIAAQREQLARLQNGASVRQRKIVRAAMAQTGANLARMRPGSWGMAQQQATMIMLGQAVKGMNMKQISEMGDDVLRAAKLSQRDAAKYLGTLDKTFHGVARPLRFDTLPWWEQHSKQLGQVRLRQYGKSFARYGGQAVSEIEEAIGKAVLSGESWGAARAKVWRATRHVVEDRQWMVDRILRTETAAAYNATTLAALYEEDEPDDPMFKKLVATFDDVTGADSIAVHGQTKRLAEKFVDPIGRHYDAPPNRPHDREIVVGWRKSYGKDIPDFDAATATAARKPDVRGPVVEPTKPPKPIPIVPPIPATPGAIAGMEAQVAEVRAVKAALGMEAALLEQALISAKEAMAVQQAIEAQQLAAAHNAAVQAQLEAVRQEIAELVKQQKALSRKVTAAKKKAKPKPPPKPKPKPPPKPKPKPLPKPKPPPEPKPKIPVGQVTGSPMRVGLREGDVVRIGKVEGKVERVRIGVMDEYDVKLEGIPEVFTIEEGAELTKMIPEHRLRGAMDDVDLKKGDYLETAEVSGFVEMRPELMLDGDYAVRIGGKRYTIAPDADVRKAVVEVPKPPPKVDRPSEAVLKGSKTEPPTKVTPELPDFDPSHPAHRLPAALRRRYAASHKTARKAMEDVDMPRKHAVFRTRAGREDYAFEDRFRASSTKAYEAYIEQDQREVTSWIAARWTASAVEPESLLVQHRLHRLGIGSKPYDAPPYGRIRMHGARKFWADHDGKLYTAEVGGEELAFTLDDALVDLYAHTQAAAEHVGLERMTIYRGIRDKQAEAIRTAVNAGEKYEIGVSPLSSWTDSYAAAMEFTDTSEIMLVKDLAARDIFMDRRLSPYRVGALEENEVVPLHSEWQEIKHVQVMDDGTRLVSTGYR